jgi:predicted RNA-binding protein YlqC (UPF0109 family)
MSELPGGSPTFEEPDFSQLSEEADLPEEEGETAPEEEAGEPGSFEEANAAEGGRAKAVLEHLARSIVDDKEAVVVEAKHERGQLRLYLHVAPSDMGRIIGRRGRTAQALRTLVRAAAATEGADTFVEIVD